MRIVLLAPGPSMSADLAESFRGEVVGVVGNCFELAPWASFLVAQDRAWWQAHPAALEFAGRRFSGNVIRGVEKVPDSRTNWNSGVLALQAAVYRMGAKEIELHGFDMHGTHYFGEYRNGLSNTTAGSRAKHFGQYAIWSAMNKGVEVVNCTPGSALKCFPMAEHAQ